MSYPAWFVLIYAVGISALAGIPLWLSMRSLKSAIMSAISDLERLNEVLSAGIGDQVRVREIIEKLKGAVE